MKTLSLEFSSDRRSVALIEDGKTLGTTFESGGRQTHAAGLVQSVIAQCAGATEAMDAIIIGLGPGSYAGIRAGIAFAQGWQLARQIKVAGVSSAELIAVRCWRESVRGPIDVAIDAQRGDFYLGSFDLSSEGLVESRALRIVSTDEIVRRTTAGGRVFGPDTILQSLGGKHLFPVAEDVDRFSPEKLRWVDGSTLQPIYLREPNFVKALPPRALA